MENPQNFIDATDDETEKDLIRKRFDDLIRKNTLRCRAEQHHHNQAYKAAKFLFFAVLAIIVAIFLIIMTK